MSCCLSCCQRIGQFPEMGSEVVPFSKHPWKMFAINPVTFLVWRGIGVALQDELPVTDAKVMGLFGFNMVMYLAHLSWNKRIVDVAIQSPFCSSDDRLRWAIRATYVIHVFNLFEALLGDNTDKRLGDDAVTMRVCFVAFSVLLSVALISFANLDNTSAGNRNSALLNNQFNDAPDATAV